MEQTFWLGLICGLGVPILTTVGLGLVHIIRTEGRVSALETGRVEDRGRLVHIESLLEHEALVLNRLIGQHEKESG